MRPADAPVATRRAESFGFLERFARSQLHQRLANLKWGRLVLRDELGSAVFGGGEGPSATIEVHDGSMYMDVATQGSVGAGEAYARGLWSTDDLVAVTRILVRNRDVLQGMESGLARLGGAALRFWHLRRDNTRDGSRANIAAHYDLGNDFYALWLDETMMYSCAAWEREGQTLHQAQVARLERICRKLDLRPGEHLLEIGTGWGGMALHAAREFGCRVTTTTISRRQHELATERVARAGLSNRVTVLLEDYRDLQGQYDKLVSLEMVEAVGERWYDTYFKKCSDLLKPEGLMLLQAITIRDSQYKEALRSVDFIQRFIFPGSSFIPSVGRDPRPRRARDRLQPVPPRGHRAALRAHARFCTWSARAIFNLRAAVGVLPLLLRGRLRGAPARQRAAAADQARLQARAAVLRMMPGPPGPLAQLAALAGPDVLVTDTATIEPMLTDHRQVYRGRALALALPRSTAEVARILAFCNAQRIGVVPQAGNTSYCGGATPDESGTQLVVSLRRMRSVRALDAVDGSIVVEAGCVLADVQRAAQSAGKLFPLQLGSEGTCQIGGNLSTNAGGTNVVRYGMVRDLVLGLEVVLPDGRVLENLSTLRKDNTGYDLKSLFLGAEGTLGIITAASLRLFPAERTAATAFVAVADVAAAVELLSLLREASGDRVSSFELLPRIAVDLAVRHIDGIKSPLDDASPWYVLCELTSPRPDEPLGQILEATLGAALARGLVGDAALAQNERERAAYWRLRESVPAAQSRAGASLKHDVSVAVSQLPRFVAAASGWVAQHVPEGVLVAYGHVGDGNLHFNIGEAPGSAPGALVARLEPIRRAIHDMVRDFGGSFSAEHGVGRSKVGELERYATPVELELMRAIKRTLDPNGIMNPGKVLRA